MHFLKRLLSWAEKNERHLGAVLFVFGFITDLFTFAVLSVSLVNLAFIAYLIIATISTLGSHLFSEAREHPTMWRRVLSIVFPLTAQYSIGSLLSGCLIFYSKSASVFVSWPFLLILALVFIGNEYFRTYYKHLAFQALLLFFAIYAYAIFALPLVIHKLGPWVFLSSTGLSVILFGLFLFLLVKTKKTGFLRSLRFIVPGCAIILVVMVGSYFGGLIPPIPLTMPTAGVYHNVSHRQDGYIVTSENDAHWWDILGTTVHHVPGTPLFVFTSVSAPFQFATYVVHSWEYYDQSQKKWVEKNKISFMIAGGRDAGYRGYSELSDVLPGKWRVTIQTPDGQTIGRIYFTVDSVTLEPLVKEESK